MYNSHASLRKFHHDLTDEQYNDWFFERTGVRTTLPVPMIAPEIKTPDEPLDILELTIEDQYYSRLPAIAATPLSSSVITPPVSRVLQKAFGFVASTKNGGLKRLRPEMPDMGPRKVRFESSTARGIITGLLAIVGVSNNQHIGPLLLSAINKVEAGFQQLPTQVFSGPQNDITVEIPESLTYCSKSSPLIVETALGTFVEKDSDLCKRIKQAVMTPSQSFTQYNENIGVRALEDGSFEFRLATFARGTKSVDDLIKEHPKGSLFGDARVRQAYIDAYRLKTNLNGAEAGRMFAMTDRYVTAERASRNFTPKPGQESFELAHPAQFKDLGLKANENVQKVLTFASTHSMDSFMTRPISAQNYRAAIGAWMISPLPWSFYLAKWNRESGFDENAHGAGSASGLNQFTIPTFLYAVKKYGVQVGLTDLHAQVMKLATYKNSKGQTVARMDSETIKDPRFQALFAKESVNPNYSTAFGVLNTAAKIEKLQAAVNRGDIKLPGGRKIITEVEGYMAHYLANNVNRILNARVENPQAMMVTLIPHNVYVSNLKDFQNETVESYFAKISRKDGFGDRPLDISKWFKDGHGRSFTAHPENLNVTEGIGTKFKIVANPSTAHNVLTIKEYPNVGWIKSQYHGIGVEPLPG